MFFVSRISAVSFIRDNTRVPKSVYLTIRGWTVRVSNAGRGKGYFSSPEGPKELYDLPSLLFN